MPEGFVPVASYWSVEEARLAKLRLESDEITVELEGESTTMLWHFANATGGVKLLVKDVDAERAREVLDALPSDESSPLLSPEEMEAEGIDVQLTSGDEAADGDDDDDDETENNRTTGTLSGLRSVKGPVICLFLAPLLFAILGGLVIIAEQIALFIRGH